MCPACGQALIAFELEGVEIDHCIACRGTWLDAGELEQITELAGAPAGPLTAALLSAQSGTRSSRRCPICRRRLRVIALGAAPRVELDRCPHEHGLWFDAGELRALIESFAEGEAGAVAAHLSDLFRHEMRTGAQGG